MARMSRPYASMGKTGKEFPTYAELKKNLKKLIQESPDHEVTIFRSRRGEWGEWFEKWILSSYNYNNGEPIIIKQGWM
jgi:hypothetical protein